MKCIRNVLYCIESVLNAIKIFVSKAARCLIDTTTRAGWENSSRSRNQSDCRICRIPPAHVLRKKSYNVDYQRVGKAVYSSPEWENLKMWQRSIKTSLLFFCPLGSTKSPFWSGRGCNVSIISCGCVHIYSVRWHAPPVLFWVSCMGYWPRYPKSHSTKQISGQVRQFLYKRVKATDCLHTSVNAPLILSDIPPRCISPKVLWRSSYIGW